MQRPRFDIEYPFTSRSCKPARLLHQETHRAGLIQQAQSSLHGRRLEVARIHEHAATHQDAVDFSHHRGDPAHVEIALAATAAAVLAFLYISADRWLPKTLVR